MVAMQHHRVAELAGLTEPPGPEMVRVLDETASDFYVTSLMFASWRHGRRMGHLPAEIGATLASDPGTSDSIIRGARTLGQAMSEVDIESDLNDLGFSGTISLRNAVDAHRLLVNHGAYAQVCDKLEEIVRPGDENAREPTSERTAQVRRLYALCLVFIHCGILWNRLDELSGVSTRSVDLERPIPPNDPN